MMPAWSPFGGVPLVAQPPATDLGEILADLDDNAVAAPGDQDALAAVVERSAAEHDLQLLVVMVPEAGSSAELAELAAQVQRERGGTVLVLSPEFAAARSDHRFDSDTLTAAVDNLPLDNVAATEEFVARLTDSGPPWLAIVLVAAVLLAAVLGVGRWWERRRRGRRDAAALAAEGTRLRAEVGAMAEPLLAAEPRVSLRDDEVLAAEYDEVVVRYRDLTHAVEQDPPTRRTADELTTRVRALRERLDAITTALGC